MGDNKEELERAPARAANVAVRSTRVLVIVDLIGELMGGNRTTFEGERI